MEKICNYIDGQLVEPISGSYIDNYNPSTGKVYSLIPDSNSQDVDAAVSSAKKAFFSWGKLQRRKDQIC